MSSKAKNVTSAAELFNAPIVKTCTRKVMLVAQTLNSRIDVNDVREIR